MKLISHELPLDLMVKHEYEINDYTYVLLHKLIEDEAYAAAVMDIRKTDPLRLIYLDNSCYELGASLDNKLLKLWSDKASADIVILPDVLGNRGQTLSRTFEYLDEYPQAAVYGMAVAQGSNPDELIDCYAELRDYRSEFDHPIEMIAIPFVFSWIERDPGKQSAERIRLLRLMDSHRIIDRNRRHHLLGTWQAQEFLQYRNYGWVWSIDTSNPIMAAIDGTPYGPVGLDSKPKATFDSSYHLKGGDIDMDLLYSNVNMFRRIVNG
jgi:hypothetical protein